MAHCPVCGAEREESDDYCPVCGETLTEVHLSEATGPPWYEHSGLLIALALVFWPMALYGLYKRGLRGWGSDSFVLGISFLMALVWGFIL